MSIKNFIPMVMATGINRELEKNLVYAEDCNRQYEGNIKKVGDSIKILGVAKPTIKEGKGKLQLESPEDVEDSSIIMKIDRWATFNYLIDDLDKSMGKGGVQEALNEETTQGLADKIDKAISELALDDGVILDKKTANTVTKDNVLDIIDDALVVLYNNNVKQTDKIVITVPPKFYKIFKQAYTTLDTNNSEELKNGQVGHYGNVKVKMTTNVAKKGDDYRIMLRTNKAIAFANPLIHNEAYRPEKGFADAVKGYIAYGCKIVRPKEMVVLNCKVA